MPSFQWFKSFSKKKAHGASKFHDYHHGYDNLRHSSGFPTTPPTMMGQHHQYNQPPPHSFSHRQHLYPQQLIMQSPPPNQITLPPQHQFQPQVITATTNGNHNGSLTNTNGHPCQCNQCSFQQPQMQMQVTGNHQINNNAQHQLIQHQQSPPAQTLSQEQMPIIDNHMPIINPPSQQHPQHQPQQHQQMVQPFSPVQMPQLQHQHQHIYQQCQHMNQPPQIQQPMYQCQNTTTPNSYANQSFTTNTLAQVPHSPPQPLAQCTCQHCPYQQQQQGLSSQQQFTPQLDHVQTNGTCQHQMTSPMVHNGINLNVNQQMTHLQNNPHNHVIQQQQQHHNRVQSLHQQQTQPMQQHTHQSLHRTTHLAQSQSQLTYQDHPHSPEAVSQPQQRQLESRAHDFSRYANMQSLMDNTQIRTDYNQSSKYQEHVYYNQKPELPPYQPPPDYETFIEHRKMYATEFNARHMTHHSESLVFQNAKDSSYENLRTKSLYSNLCTSRQEPGYTS